MAEQMELKAYKMLAEIKGGLLDRIIRQAANKVEYFKGDNPDELITLLSHVADIKKWDYCGLLSNEKIAVLETLEYLLDDKTKIK